jgi:cytochrome P450/NADPH-cytochrome P450 reductase
MSTNIREIPGPAGWPIVGNLFQIPRQHVTQYLLKISRNFDGIFQLNFAGRRVPFVYSAELVAELCDQTRFRKVIAPPLSFLRTITGDGLFTAESNNPNWGKARRILMPTFSQEALKSYFDSMSEVVDELLNKWKNQGPDQDILVAEDMTRLTFEVVSRCGFGYSFKPFESQELPPFLQAFSRTLTRSSARLSQFPFTRIFKSQKQKEKDMNTLSSIVDDIIAQRRQSPQHSNDLLSRLLNSVDPKTGESLDDQNIHYQVMTFLMAGHETTSGMLSFALSLLLSHPQVLEQAYTEVDHVFANNTKPQFEQIAELEVLDRVVKESLRLWPTVPALMLAPFEDTVIGGQYRIAKDHWVFVILPALHRDPKIWNDPESFNIDRFIANNIDERPHCAYLPFGTGQRACMGRQFAILEAKLALAMILRDFKLSAPTEYTLKIKESLTLKTKDFLLRAQQRHSN